MSQWGGSSSPARISYLFATHQEHFGAPFLLPVLLKCVTHPYRVCDTFGSTVAAAGLSDRLWDTLRDTFVLQQIDKTRRLSVVGLLLLDL